MLAAVGERYYKVTAEALRVCGELVKAIRPNFDTVRNLQIFCSCIAILQTMSELLRCFIKPSMFLRSANSVQRF